MKALSLATLITLSCLFASCKSSTETNGPLVTYSLVKPKVGSTFIYQQQVLDSNGNVRSDVFRSDSIWRVVAADTSIMDHVHVWLVQSFETDSDLYPYQTVALSFLDNGDFEFAQDLRDESELPWMRMPLSSQVEQLITLDTTIAGDSASFHVHETWRTSNTGVSEVTVNGTALQAVTFSTKNDGVATSAQNETLADVHGVDNWTFIPTLGFFAKRDMMEHIDNIDGESRGDGKRMTLVRYELK